MLLSLLSLFIIIQISSPESRLERIARLHDLGDGYVIYGIIGATPTSISIGNSAGKTRAYFNLSKPITAAAVMELVELGTIGLDEEIEGATVAQLLSHSAGWDSNIDGDPVTSASRDTECMNLPAPEKQFTPGAKQVYSNIGYCILGRLIEERTGQPYDDAIRMLIPEVRGMSYNAWLGPAGGWSGTAGQYWDFASRPLNWEGFEGPPPGSPQPHYGFGWALGEHDISHYGMITGEGYNVVMRSGDTLGLAMFDNSPADPVETRNDLRPLLRSGWSH